MEKDKQFFPLENLISGNKKVGKLIEKHGPRGFGTYVMVLTELRFSEDYQITTDNLKGTARRCKMKTDILDSVLNDYDLFDIRKEKDETIVSSPYIDRVMKRYEDRIAKHAEISAKGYNKSKRASDGKFTAAGGVIEKNRIEKNKTTTAVVAKAAVAADGWEKYLEEAVNDQAWMELLAMNSGFGRLFAKHREFIIEAFRQHANLQGKTNEIFAARDVKAYFANFLRQGTPTQKRLAAQLAGREEHIRQTSPYRFETIDPETGERSYFGNLIPPDAPPRPNDNAAWAESIKAWI